MNGKSQASEKLVSLGEYARTTVHHSVRQAVLVDVIDDFLVVSPWLEPQRGDPEELGLFDLVPVVDFDLEVGSNAR